MEKRAQVRARGGRAKDEHPGAALRRRPERRGAVTSGQPVRQLADLNLQELRVIAAEHGISGRSRMKKKQLLKALRSK